MVKLSLLTKLVIIAVVVLAVDVFLFIAIIKPDYKLKLNGQENPQVSNINQPVINASKINSELSLNVQINATANKSIYISYEKVIIDIDLLSNQNLNDVLIKAKGITSRLKRDYFNQNKIIDLPKQTNQKIILSQTLPSCNSCSGLSPGNYQIAVTAEYQGQILAAKKINLTIKQ